MTQALISDVEAKVTNASTFKVSMTALELQFMVFQMEASVDACNRASDDPLNNAHIQGLNRILTKFRNAYPNWKPGI